MEIQENQCSIRLKIWVKNGRSFHKYQWGHIYISPKIFYAHNSNSMQFDTAQLHQSRIMYMLRPLVWSHVRFCSDHCIRIWTRAKCIFLRIWIMIEFSSMKWGPSGCLFHWWNLGKISKVDWNILFVPFSSLLNYHKILHISRWGRALIFKL